MKLIAALVVVLSLCSTSVAQETLFKSGKETEAHAIFKKSLTEAGRKSVVDFSNEPDVPIKKSEALPPGLIYWALKNADISWQKEAELANEKRTKLDKDHKFEKTPAAVEELFQSLVKSLPGGWPDKGFKIELLDQDTPAVYSPGGGLIVLSTGLVKLLEENDSGKEMLAFVLGRELGHCVLGHCNQRLCYECKLVELIKDDAVKKHLAGRLADGGIKFTDQQQYLADLFALHLCRNAEIDVDKALDFLRLLVLCEFPEGVGKGKQEWNEVRERSYLDYRHYPPAFLRYKFLQLEATATVNGDAFGLFRIDPETKKATKVTEKVNEATIVIFLHGMLGGENTFKEFFRADHPLLADKNVAILLYRYPHNGSLATGGAFFMKEVKRLVPQDAKIVLVCHSAGGLVARYAVEVKGLKAEKVIFLGVPHDGSGLTKLKVLADLNDLIPGIVAVGWSDKVRAMIAEGSGEIGIDLHTGSLFLQHLGKGKHRCEDYYVFHGRVIDFVPAAAAKAAFNLAKDTYIKKMRAKEDLPFLVAEGLALLERTELPDEILFGDGVVSVKSALKVDCRKSFSYRLNHDQLTTDPRVITAVLELIHKK